MIADPAGWTVVLNGHWNRMILSPDWLRKYDLRSEGPVAMEVPVIPGTGAARLRFEGVSLAVESQRLVLAVDEAKDEHLERIERIAVKILETLSHTPVQAVGVNFRWTESEPDVALARTFDISDGGNLADAGLVLQTTNVARQLNDSGQIVNLQLQLAENRKVTFDFNFHTAATDTTTAGRALAGQALLRKARALEILKAVYELEPEQ